MNTSTDPPADRRTDDQPRDVYSCYTPTMLAELLEVPVQAIRRWHRKGYLQSCRTDGGLPYFDYSEVAVARHLTTLLSSGSSLASIDRKLDELRRSMPEVARPLCESSVVVSSGKLVVRRGDDLAEPGGQLLMDFGANSEESEPTEVLLSVERSHPSHAATSEATTPSTFAQLQLEALKLENDGQLAKAAEIYRTLLMAGEPTAETHFALADLLYRMGDLSAARERFYAAIELDEEYVEARASLGCVLVEIGEIELAVAAFEGALAFHADYADVHFHLANALDRLGDFHEAEMHWQTFLALAPESPWAETARAQLNRRDEFSEVFLTT